MLNDTFMSIIKYIKNSLKPPAKNPIVIHTITMNPRARATLMVADILGIDVRQCEAVPGARNHFQPEHVKNRSLMTVPVMEDGLLEIKHSHAVITYFVSAYGNDEQKALYPSEPVARAMVDQYLYFDATILFPRLNSALRSLVEKRKKLAGEQINDILECYVLVEKILEDRLYIASNVLTLADIACIATLSTMNCIVTIEKRFVKLHGWWQRLEKESWYINVNLRGLERFCDYIKEYLY